MKARKASLEDRRVRMASTLTVLAAAVVALPPVLGGTRLADPRAAAVLAGARQALGAVENVQSLSFAVECDETADRGQGKTYQARLEIHLVLPDRYLIARRPAAIPGLVEEVGFQGAALIRRAESPRGVTVGGRAPWVTEAQSRVIDERRVGRLRRDATRLLVGVLLADRTPLPVTWAYGGHATSGDDRAEVLDATGPENLALRLFIDQATSLPLMMTFDELEVRPRGGQPGAVAEPSGPDLPILETVPQALYFGDHRRADGLVVPHTITRTVANRTVEQWRVERVRVNPRGILDAFPK